MRELQKRGLWAAAILFLFPAFLFPRDVEIVVEDADLGIPLEGARIRSGDGREYRCDGEGRAVVGVSDTRPAVLGISHPGYESRRLVVPLEGDRFTAALVLGDVMEGRELVIEVPRPGGASERRIGRSVTVAGEDLKRTAEIGIVEDVMTSIKLLPGVGYTGMFNAMPSIRGGNPGDLTAVLDGFYVEDPYHWGGMVSIFDPRMVESAQLSHGVFSTRYGHTVSGILDIRSRKPSPTEFELDLGLSTSAAHLNLSFPLGGRGGIMAMGKVSYWDPFVWAAKQFIEEVGYIRTAPYIRSAALGADYRFTADLEGTLQGFFGADGAGAFYANEYQDGGDRIRGRNDMDFDWQNLLGFLSSGLSFTPRPSMLVRAVAGAGIVQSDLAGKILQDMTIGYSDGFRADYGPLIGNETEYRILQDQHITMTTATVNLQGRADFDWDLGGGFLFAAGVQELYSQWIRREEGQGYLERSKAELAHLGPPYSALPDGAYAAVSLAIPIDVDNRGMNSSAYSLVEYSSPQKRFGAELGIRGDHLFFVGRDFTIQTWPVLNPRLNLDLELLKDRGVLESLSFTLGTGLFSSLNDSISLIQTRSGIEDFELKPNRSWTSIGGTRIDLAGGLTFTLEGYFKYVFNHAYEALELDPPGSRMVIDFDGEGRIWGFDMMLQKLEARYWDGWISYSFTHARYRNPHTVLGLGAGGGGEWYYPSFHRFHNFNLVLNIKPLRVFNIALRLGLAGGAPEEERGEITRAPLLLPDGTIAEVYKQERFYSDTRRTPWSIPLDVKFSWYFFNPRGKVQGEVYLGIENLQSLFYKPRREGTFNRYTGREDTGSMSASYEMPIPMPSFGFRWSY